MSPIEPQHQVVEITLELRREGAERPYELSEGKDLMKKLIGFINKEQGEDVKISITVKLVPRL